MKKLIIMSLLCLTLTSCSSTDDSKTNGANEGGSTNVTQDSSTDETDITSEPTGTEDEDTVDAVTTPSITGDKEEVAKSLSADGNWITAITNNVTLDDALTVDGTFYDKNDNTKDVYRKLALYAQDADKNVTDTYTLTVPEMTVSSENFRIQEGTVVGDITVSANGFELKNSTIDGSLTFTSEEFKSSAKLDEGTVTGEIK